MKPYGQRINGGIRRWCPCCSGAACRADLKQRAAARRVATAEVTAQLDAYHGWEHQAHWMEEQQVLDQASDEAMGRGWYDIFPETALDVFYATKAMRDRATMHRLGYTIGPPEWMDQ